MSIQERKEKMDLLEYNLVNNKTSIKPNYKTKIWEMSSIKAYIDLNGKIIIIGEIDNNYIYWLSITNINDTLLNEKICDFVSKGEYDLVSNKSTVLNYNNIDYYSFKEMYCINISKLYGNDNIKSFPKDAICIIDSLQKKCLEYGELNAINFLNNLYKDISKTAPLDYSYSFKEKLEQVDFLKMSANKDIRDLYNKCCLKEISLYRIYMSLVK